MKRRHKFSFGFGRGIGVDGRGDQSIMGGWWLVIYWVWHPVWQRQRRRRRIIHSIPLPFAVFMRCAIISIRPFANQPSSESESQRHNKEEWGFLAVFAEPIPLFCGRSRKEGVYFDILFIGYRREGRLLLSWFIIIS